MNARTLVFQSHLGLLSSRTSDYSTSAPCTGEFSTDPLRALTHQRRASAPRRQPEVQGESQPRGEEEQLLCCKAGSPTQKEPHTPPPPPQEAPVDGWVGFTMTQAEHGTPDSSLYSIQVFYWNVYNWEKALWRFSLCMLDEASERFQRVRG